MSWCLAFGLLAAPVVASAADVKKTVAKAAKTGADAVVDSGRTVGRSTKAFVKEGARGAKPTWKANAGDTARNAKKNADATRDAAKSP
jgi:hypothetical protein